MIPRDNGSPFLRNMLQPQRPNLFNMLQGQPQFGGTSNLPGGMQPGGGPMLPTNLGAPPAPPSPFHPFRAQQHPLQSILHILQGGVNQNQFQNMQQGHNPGAEHGLFNNMHLTPETLQAIAHLLAMQGPQSQVMFPGGGRIGNYQLKPGRNNALLNVLRDNAGQRPFGHLGRFGNPGLHLGQLKNGGGPIGREGGRGQELMGGGSGHVPFRTTPRNWHEILMRKALGR